MAPHGGVITEAHGSVLQFGQLRFPNSYKTGSRHYDFRSLWVRACSAGEVAQRREQGLPGGTGSGVVADADEGRRAKFHEGGDRLREVEEEIVAAGAGSGGWPPLGAAGLPALL